MHTTQNYHNILAPALLYANPVCVQLHEANDSTPKKDNKVHLHGAVQV